MCTLLYLDDICQQLGLFQAGRKYVRKLTKVLAQPVPTSGRSMTKHAGRVENMSCNQSGAVLCAALLNDG